ncbi:hypothetical protein PV516_18950 [Streptomyces scabiei]|uniref:hypothetical protein n=1 Tax=Streptomyces scabiei TaxID=1930 RepID=UPI0029B2A631|nr:hypothetical protein [Streptomyces scabiei]MDX3165866.1 hypothetical protein [Streptomyces scabiei]
MDPDLELVPPPKLNGGQMACVSARYALQETPALAHFTAVHHHMDQVLRTVGLNDKWMQENVDRVRRDLDVLEQALNAGQVPDLTERDSPNWWKTAFEGIPSGLRQPLDASKGWRDHSRAYRPNRSAARRRGGPSRADWVVGFVLAVILLSYFANRT